jgi:hypothetical protein
MQLKFFERESHDRSHGLEGYASPFIGTVDRKTEVTRLERSTHDVAERHACDDYPTRFTSDKRVGTVGCGFGTQPSEVEATCRSVFEYCGVSPRFPRCQPTSVSSFVGEQILDVVYVH